MIIDAHLHLDLNRFNTPAEATAFLDEERQNANINHCIVLHLEDQNWSKEAFADAISVFPRIHGLVNLLPLNTDCCNQLKHAVTELGYIGLKLHPRLQNFSIEEPSVVELLRKAGELAVPVLIDAFPDGTHIMQGFSAINYAQLALKAPETKIIIAHMGGHHVLDFMMLAKRIPNIYFDISYSFLYYSGSSIPLNMIYAMKSMRFDRIFYGSDYPDRSLVKSLNQSIAVLKEHLINEDNLHKIMYSNAANFFGLSE